MIDLEKVSPEKAADWLSRNECNRGLKKDLAKQYEQDMRNGNWTKCVAPIAFYEDGQLADGQHRLRAIADSGVTQAFYVVRGLARKDGLNIDTGVTRTVVDAAKISGVGVCTSEMIAVARVLVAGRVARWRRDSNAVKMQALERHRGIVEFVCQNAPRGKHLRTSLALGAGARAIQHGEDRERVVQFFKVLTDGIMAYEGDVAAVALRNYLLQGGQGVIASHAWNDTFMRAQRALQAFIKGEKLTRTYPVKEEVYPAL